MSGFQAIVFDLDDTLYAERAYVRSGFRAVAAWLEEVLHVSSTEVFNELDAIFEAGNRSHTFDSLLERRGMLRAVRVETLLAVYRSHEPTIDLYPGMRELLKRLRRRYRLGLVSDGSLAVQRRKVSALEIEALLDAIVLSDKWGREAWKPSTVPFREVLRKLGVAAQQAVYVADNMVKDFAGPASVGMHTIRLRWPTGLYSHLDAPSLKDAPEWEVQDAESLNAVLAAFGNDGGTA